jgi:hypothetical protein
LETAKIRFFPKKEANLALGRGQLRGFCGKMRVYQQKSHSIAVAPLHRWGSIY